MVLYSNQLASELPFRGSSFTWGVEMKKSIDINRLGWIALAGVFLLGYSIGASAQDHPAFEPAQRSMLTVESVTPDIPALESATLDLLTTRYGLTAEEALAKVRVDGKTDVARCIEFIVIEALRGISQATVIGTVVATQHPSETVLDL